MWNCQLSSGFLQSKWEIKFYSWKIPIDQWKKIKTLNAHSAPKDQVTQFYLKWCNPKFEDSQ